MDVELAKRASRVPLRRAWDTARARAGYINNYGLRQRAQFHFVEPFTAGHHRVHMLIRLDDKIHDPRAGVIEHRFDGFSHILFALAADATDAKGFGPSPEATAALVDLKKWGSEVDSEAIPMRDHGGTHQIDVQLAGEHFMMDVDTGASFILLPGEIAEQLKMSPGEQDRTLQLRLANGSRIEGKEKTIKSVRVGRFTLEDVPCVVLEKGLPNAPLLLGGSFLNHFIVKLDPGTNELRLTALKAAAATKPSIKPTGALKE
jgi:clan AA aspartic protease (TIGR02281 family)